MTNARFRDARPHAAPRRFLRAFPGRGDRAARTVRVLGTALLVAGLTTWRAAPAAARAEPDSPRLGSDRAMQLFANGVLAESRGELDAAYQAYQHAYLIEPTSATLIRHLAEVVLRMGDVVRAGTLAEEGLRADSTDARLYALRAHARRATGDGKGAVSDMARAAECDTTNADYALTLAGEYDQTERLEEARRMYERAVALGDADPEAKLRYALVLGRLGRFSEALPLLDDAAQSGARLPTLPLTRAWVLDGVGRHAESVPVYIEHLRSHADDQTVRRRLVNALMAVGRDAEALPHARQLYEADPSLATGRVLAGIHLRLGQPERAREVAREVRRRVPLDLDVAEFEIALLVRMKQYDAAVADARSLAEEAPGGHRAWLLYASTLIGANRRDQAAQVLGRAEKLLPDSAGAHLALGRVSMLAADYARAEGLFSRALALGADSAAAWYEIASARERRKDIDGAEEAVQRVLALQPDNPQVLNFLGYLYADYSRKLEEAVRLVRRALELDPDNGYYMDSLGWAYYRLGELDSARVHLERALGAGGEDPTILEHLGDVHMALQQPELAKQKYRRALELGPEDPAAVREKLRKLP